MSIAITVFDGANTIGGSKIHLQDGDTGLFLDFGANFKKYGLYFEEFLRPRSVRGICDFLAMGLIPRLKGIYRPDIFPSDITLKEAQTVQVDSIFLSHAHLDHTGNAGLLDLSIPLICSSMTAVIAKAIQDSGCSGIESEILYTNERVSEDGYLVKSNKVCKGRQIHLADEPSSEVRDYLGKLHSKTKSLECTPLIRSVDEIKGLKLRIWNVDHSIFGATAIALETSAGWIVYTGDFRLHGSRGDLSQIFVEEAVTLKPAILIIEGTNISEPSRISEEEVHSRCLEAVNSAKGKIVIADFGPRNVERLLTFLDIAKATKRILIITPKDAFLLDKMRLVDHRIPALDDPDWLIFKEPKTRIDGWEKNLIDRYEGKYVKPQDIKSSQGDFILCFGFLDLNDLIDIEPEGGVYIYSTSEAFTEALEMDVWRLSNWLDRFNIEPVGFSFPKRAHSETEELYKPEFVKGFHSSGHLCGNELVEVIQKIKPKTVIPIHTEHPELFAERIGKDAEVILPEEAKPMIF